MSFRDIEIVGPRRVSMYKKLWAEQELALAKCLNLEIDIDESAVYADLETTTQVALLEFIKESFRSFAHNPENKIFRERVYEDLSKRYEEMHEEFYRDVLSKAGYHDTLFWHQKDALASMAHKKFNLLSFEQGLGKTISAATISKIFKIRRTIVICPALVKWNWYRDLTDKKWGFNELFFTILDAAQSKCVKAFQERFVIVNYEMVGKFLKELAREPIGHIIIDECFHYDTPILTDEGWVSIGDIVDKKISTKVLSFNSDKNVYEYKSIIRRLANELGGKTFVKINTFYGSIICTYSHKIWTSKGYKTAGSIQKGDIIYSADMRTMLKGVRLSERKQSQEKILLMQLRSEMENESTGKTGETIRGGEDFWEKETWMQKTGCLNKNEDKQSNEQSSQCPENGRKNEGKNISWQGREWRADEAAISIALCDQIADGICDSNESNLFSNAELAEVLQGRLSYSGKENSDRSRRKDPQIKEVEILGQEKRAGSFPIGVESIEVLERGGGHEFGWLYSKNKVYDIEVEDNHNYFADGFLVSNCHMIKNHNSGRFKAIAKLIEENPDARVSFLSGTPVKNRVNDMFSYLKLSGHPLGENYTGFLRDYTQATSGRGGSVKVSGGRNLDKLYVMMSNFMIRRTKAECLDLPPKIIYKYRFELDDYREEYNKIIAELVKQKDTTNLHSSMHSLNIIVAKSKIKGIIEMANSILEQGRKVIIFSGYKEPLNMLAEHFGKACVKIDGSVPSHMRDTLIQKFIHDDNVTLYIANRLAGGIGVNLVNAADIISVDFPFVPADLWQSEDRSHRIGQVNSVNIYYTICEDSIDEHLYDIICDKATDINALVDRGKETVDYTNIPEMLYKRLVEKYIVTHGQEEKKREDSHIDLKEGNDGVYAGDIAKQEVPDKAGSADSCDPPW